MQKWAVCGQVTLLWQSNGLQWRKWRASWLPQQLCRVPQAVCSTETMWRSEELLRQVRRDLGPLPWHCLWLTQRLLLQKVMRGTICFSTYVFKLNIIFILKTTLIIVCSPLFKVIYCVSSIIGINTCVQTWRSVLQYLVQQPWFPRKQWTLHCGRNMTANFSFQCNQIRIFS